jgi:tetratricopeptide (TPR) repeat protein
VRRDFDGELRSAGLSVSYFMPTRILLWVLLLAGGLLAGCHTSSGGKRAVAKSSAADVSNSPAAIERRTEAHAHYAAAVLYDARDENDLAAEEYLKAGLADVSNEELVLEIASRLLQFKANDKAMELLAKAAEERTASGQLYAQLGRAYSLAGKKDEAIEANRTAIRKAPRSAVGYRHLAQIYLQSGQSDEGLKVLDEAARQPEADAGFLVELAEFYFVFGRAGSIDAVKARILEILNRAEKQKTTNPLLQQKLGDYYAVLGETKKASALYLKLLERFPRLHGLRDKLVNIYLGNQDTEHAAEQLEVILRDNPTSSQAYYTLGRIALEDKKPAKAAECFSKVILLNENFAPGYYDLTGAQLNLDQPREALATLEKARARFKTEFVSEFYTALAYNRLKEYTNSVKHFVSAEVIARATDTNRLTGDFYFRLGAAYERTQDYDEAEHYFKKCLALSPDFSEALNYLGYMWADRGLNLSEAHDLIEKAVKLEPKRADYLDSLGWVLFKLDKPKEALPHLLRAIEESKEPDATLYDHLGDIYLALSQPDKARASWQKALTLDPAENKDKIQKKLGNTSPSDGLQH